MRPLSGLPWEIYMINLIPNEEKKKMAKDFYFRLAVVFFVMFTVSFLIASIAILPAYFLSLVKINEATAKLETQKKEPVLKPDQATLATIKGLSSELNLVESAKKNLYIISQKVIDEIILKKMPDIKINQIVYKNDPFNGKTINIRGTAQSRERLLLFRRALEDDVVFKKVDLPISNFIKGSNIQFYLNLIPL